MLRVLIFDWGDTVMRVFPRYTGPMARWPEVAAVPGVEAALAALAGRYRLALATNAADSGAALVRDALRRVGLDGAFSAVLTFRELAARKPDAAFFGAVLAHMGCAAHEAAIIGDDYANDVAGAAAAGLRAIWYNPAHTPCPEPHPAYDADIAEMAALPTAVANLRLPDMPICLAWLAEQGASPGLVRHVKLVAAVAFRLAERLAAAGEPVDPLLAHRGGLLHDLAKVSARATGAPHNLAAGELLRARGFADLARIAERHAVWALLDPVHRPETWEERLVCYADRLADGGRLATVDERMDALIARRPELAANLERYRAEAKGLEREIAGRLGLAPGEMFEQLKEGI